MSGHISMVHEWGSNGVFLSCCHHSRPGRECDGGPCQFACCVDICWIMVRIYTTFFHFLTLFPSALLRLWSQWLYLQACVVGHMCGRDGVWERKEGSCIRWVINWLHHLANFLETYQLPLGKLCLGVNSKRTMRINLPSRLSALVLRFITPHN